MVQQLEPDQRLEYAKDCAFRYERHREIDRLWYVEVSLVECFWKVFGRKKQMWSFCVFVLFLFWGKIFDGVFYSFFVGKGGRQGVKGRWKVLEGWIKLDVVM